MDITGIMFTMINDVAYQAAGSIYQAIVMQHIIYAVKVGIFAGLVMAAVGTILGLLRFTNLDLTTYMGCMLTGTNQGKLPFIAGFVFHIIISALFGVVYLWVIHYLASGYGIFIKPTLMWGVIVGSVHSLISGSLMLILDRINPCVVKKLMGRMGFLVSAQGIRATIAYILTHIVFASIMVICLAH